MGFDAATISSIANKLRAAVLEMTTAAGSGHPGGSLSAAEIMATLFFSGLLHYDPNDPTWPDRDRFILSKGHAAPILYATLAQIGYLPADELCSLRQLDSRLQGHPDMLRLNSVEVSTGSLGQGLSVAVGMALGLEMAGSDSRVCVLLGDGELQEGQIWEAAMYASQRHLARLVAIVDNNNLQIDGDIRTICNPHSISAKFAAFGWQTFGADGHDPVSLHAALTQAFAQDGAPAVVIAKTTKGKGVSFMENDCAWHGKAANAEQCRQALTELSKCDVSHIRRSEHDAACVTMMKHPSGASHARGAEQSRYPEHQRSNPGDIFPLRTSEQDAVHD